MELKSLDGRPPISTLPKCQSCRFSYVVLVILIFVFYALQAWQVFKRKATVSQILFPLCYLSICDFFLFIVNLSNMLNKGHQLWTSYCQCHCKWHDLPLLCVLLLQNTMGWAAKLLVFISGGWNIKRSRCCLVWFLERALPLVCKWLRVGCVLTWPFLCV